MSEVLIYIGKVLVIQVVFYGFYRLVLRNSIQHGLNRLFLLAALVISFIIPFIQIPERMPIQPLVESPVIVWVQESALELEVVPVNAESEEVLFSVWHFIPLVYTLVTCILFIRSGMYLFFILKLKKHSLYVKKRWFKLFKTSQTRPFSFFSNVFIPKDVFGSNAFDQILAHECVHVKQRHSIDRLLLDFLVSLFWFNPFIYLYRNALIEIHEFQADEAVINQFNDPIGYQEVLYSQLHHATYSGLVSHFNFSMIKKRIVMMNKQKNKYSVLLYALTLPVLVSVIFAFSSKEAITPIHDLSSEIAGLIGPSNGLSMPDFKLSNFSKSDQQDSNVPSILPIKDIEKVKMTSGYGMRMHPIYKVKKMHLGTDFSCPLGTEIIAPANGTVAKVEKKEGYGNLLTIDHGDKMVTRYAQLSEFKVKEGDEVKKGNVIALSGNSGASTAPHLHYEVKKNGEYVDPAGYIKDYDFKPRVKETPSSENEARQEALHRQEQELAAQQKMLVAKEEAEQAKVDEIRANERLREATEEERKAYQLQKEAEEQRLMEEKIKKEKLKFKDSKQESDGALLEIGLEKMTLSGKKPMYILNGEEVDDVADLDLSEIDNITVLKGEKAKSKYGEKGEDGVIEIVTKDKEKEKDKDKNKDKGKEKSKEKEKIKDTDPRLNKVYEFLEDYDKKGFDPDNWNIVLKSDRVKLKRVGSLEGIVLYDEFFAKK
ncbi:peptidoglycan DD-metalloendopeptidase family protein [Ekhidna sp.]|uniref:peptidoglycan DD-metalloendopeptidase family protein n=1 Tax=Ekhidna sp. TaxID=2608089 RepID=UPI003B50F27F